MRWMSLSFMTETATSRPVIIDIEDLGFDRGAHLLIKRALDGMPVGERLGLCGRAPELAVHLRAWCRAQGYEVVWPKPYDESYGGTDDASPLIAWIVRDAAFTGRWRGAIRAGASNPGEQGAIVEHPQGTWGLAARGAIVEEGGPEFHFPLNSKTEVWADNIPRLYQQAAAAQWDPATAINWNAQFELPTEVEAAVVQLMTYLIENETAA